MKQHHDCSDKHSHLHLPASLPPASQSHPSLKPQGLGAVHRITLTTSSIGRHPHGQFTPLLRLQPWRSSKRLSLGSAFEQGKHNGAGDGARRSWGPGALLRARPQPPVDPHSVRSIVAYLRSSFIWTDLIHRFKLLCEAGSSLHIS